ncbi:hypothetical protein LTR28_006237, partial [Elasticomyces elasticus]
VYTLEGACASAPFIALLRRLGARTTRVWSERVTHVVFKDGSKRTLERVRGRNGVVKGGGEGGGGPECGGEVFCVNCRWVTACEELGKRVDERGEEFAVDAGDVPRGGRRRRKSMEPASLGRLRASLGRGNARLGRLVHVPALLDTCLFAYTYLSLKHQILEVASTPIPQRDLSTPSSHAILTSSTDPFAADPSTSDKENDVATPPPPQQPPTHTTHTTHTTELSQSPDTPDWLAAPQKLVLQTARAGRFVERGVVGADAGMVMGMGMKMAKGEGKGREKVEGRGFRERLSLR